MFSTWFIVTCSLTCAAGVLYTYLELSSCKFLLERVLDPFVHFLYPSLPPRWWAESFISSGVLSVFRFTWNKSLFMPNKWCVLFYWLLVCLDIPGEFLWETLMGTRIPCIFCFLKSWQVYIIYVNVHVSLVDQIYQVVIAVFCKLKDKTNSWFDPVQGVITHIHVIEVNLSNLKSFL